MIGEYDSLVSRLANTDEGKANSLIDLANRGPPEDPRAQTVGLDEYNSKPEKIEVIEINWDSIRVQYEGPSPRPEAREPNNNNIEEDWTDFIFDRCAWYRSFHYQPRTYWGIHIKETCWDETARKLFRSGQYRSWQDALKGAFLTIFLHEFFHYITDIASTTLEIVTNKPRIYVDYSDRVYAKVFLTPHCIEEALANRYLYGRAETVHMRRGYLYRWLGSQPLGYQQFIDFVGTRFWIGRRTLMNQIQDCLSVPAKEKPIEQVMEVLSPWEYSTGHRVPLWLHRPPRGPYRIFIH
jgi:hypothetical protein